MSLIDQLQSLWLCLDTLLLLVGAVGLLRRVGRTEGRVTTMLTGQTEILRRLARLDDLATRQEQAELIDGAVERAFARRMSPRRDSPDAGIVNQGPTTIYGPAVGGGVGRIEEPPG